MRWAGLFGVAPGTARVALHRMTAAGELVRTHAGAYELVGGLARRQEEQESSLVADPGPWDGTWRMAVVLGRARPAPVRADVRAGLARARLAEWREGVWLRPANLGDLVEDSRCAWLDVMPDDEPVALAAELFAPGAWSRRASELLDRLDRSTASMRQDAQGTMAGAFLAGAAALRHIRADPLLPEALLPGSWPGRALRDGYRTYEREFDAVGARLVPRRSADVSVQYRRSVTTPKWSDPYTPSTGVSPRSSARRGWPTPPSFGCPTITKSMRRSTSRLVAAHGLVFDHVKPGPSPAWTQASRNQIPGTGGAASPVSMRISSVAGDAFRSPPRIAGNDRGRVSRANSQIARTCSWRIAPWSSRQERCAQNAWNGPRGPSISAKTQSRSSPSSSRDPLGASRGRVRTSERLIGQRLRIALPAWTPSAKVRLLA